VAVPKSGLPGRSQLQPGAPSAVRETRYFVNRRHGRMAVEADAPANRVLPAVARQQCLGKTGPGVAELRGRPRPWEDKPRGAPVSPTSFQLMRVPSRGKHWPYEIRPAAGDGAVVKQAG